MNYNLENFSLNDQLINLALPKDFNNTKQYSLYLVFDGNELLTNQETNILTNNNTNKIYVGINNPNDVIRFNNFSTYHNQLVKNLMIRRFPELKNSKTDYLGGNGQNTINFIINDLLPWLKNIKKIQIIDLNLLGCSMGAYFSLQLLYLSTLKFKKVYLFSPSIWFNKNILDDLQKNKLNQNIPLTVNLWVGLKEPTMFEKQILTNYLQDTKIVKAILQSHKFEVNFFIEETGSHGFKWWINFINNHPKLW